MSTDLVFRMAITDVADGEDLTLSVSEIGQAYTAPVVNGEATLTIPAAALATAPEQIIARFSAANDAGIGTLALPLISADSQGGDGGGTVTPAPGTPVVQNTLRAFPILNGYVSADEAAAGFPVSGRASPGAAISVRRKSNNANIADVIADGEQDGDGLALWDFDFQGAAITATITSDDRSEALVISDGTNTVELNYEYHDYRPSITLSVPAFSPDPGAAPVSIVFNTDAEAFAFPEHTELELGIRNASGTLFAQTQFSTVNRPTKTYEISGAIQADAVNGNGYVGFARVKNRRYKNEREQAFTIESSGVNVGGGGSIDRTGLPAGWGEDSSKIPPIGTDGDAAFTVPAQGQSVTIGNRLYTNIADDAEATYAKHTPLDAGRQYVKTKDGYFSDLAGQYQDFIGSGENRWAWGTPGRAFRVSGTRLYQYDFGVGSTELYNFAANGASGSLQWGPNEGDKSADDKLFCVTAVNGNEWATQAWVWHADDGYIASYTAQQMITDANNLATFPSDPAATEDIDWISVSMRGRIVVAFRAWGYLVYERDFTNPRLIGHRVDGHIRKVYAGHAMFQVGELGEDLLFVRHYSGNTVIDLADTESIYWDDRGRSNVHWSAPVLVPGMIVMDDYEGGDIVGWIWRKADYSGQPESDTQIERISRHRRIDTAAREGTRFYTRSQLDTTDYPPSTGAVSNNGEYLTFNNPGGRDAPRRIMMVQILNGNTDTGGGAGNDSIGGGSGGNTGATVAGLPPGWGQNSGNIPSIGSSADSAWSVPGENSSTTAAGRRYTNIAPVEANYAKHMSLDAGRQYVKDKNGYYYSLTGADRGHIGSGENRWAWGTPGRAFRVSGTRLYQYDHGSGSTELFNFATQGASGSLRWGPNEGDKSADDKLFCVTAVNSSENVTQAWVWHADTGYIASRSASQMVADANALASFPSDPDAGFDIDWASVSLRGQIVVAFRSWGYLVYNPDFSNPRLIGRRVDGHIRKLNAQHSTFFVGEEQEDAMVVRHWAGCSVVDLADTQGIYWDDRGESNVHWSAPILVPGMVIMDDYGDKEVKGWIWRKSDYDGQAFSDTDISRISRHKRINESVREGTRFYMRTQIANSSDYPPSTAACSNNGQYLTTNHPGGRGGSRKMMLVEVL